MWATRDPTACSDTKPGSWRRGGDHRPGGPSVRHCSVLSPRCPAFSTSRRPASPRPAPLAAASPSPGGPAGRAGPVAAQRRRPGPARQPVAGPAAWRAAAAGRDRQGPRGGIRRFTGWWSSCCSRRCSPVGRSGWGSRSPPDLRTCGPPSSSARWAAFPPLIIVALMSSNVITESAAIAIGLAAAPLAFDLLSWQHRGHDGRPRTARDRQSRMSLPGT